MTSRTPVKRTRRRHFESSAGPGKHRLQCGVLAAAVLALSACATPVKTDVVANQAVALELEADEYIVLFPNQAGSASADVQRFVDCVKSELAEHSPSFSRIADTLEFQNALFPWFEPGHAPQTAAEMDSLLGRPEVRARIEAIRVRYLVSVALSGEEDGFPGMLCGGAMGGAGCLGASWGEKEINLNVIFWDMKSGRESGNLTLSASGKSLAIGVIIPIVFTAYTDVEACERLAAEIAAVIPAEGNPE